MTNLPLEVLLMIFEKLDFINLIKLRSICKDWKSIIDNNKIIKELIIEDKYFGFNISNKKISPIISLDQFKLDADQIFRKIISSYILKDLKYLNYSFKCNLMDKNHLIHLNCFKSLEHLVLQINLREEYQELILVHPNVKCLSVSANLIYYNDFNMEINCPKCENLRIAGDFRLENYDIIYPERIKILKLSIYDLDNNEYKIDEFINTEQLVIQTYYLLPNNAISSKISKFNKLKKITIKYNDFTNCSNGNWYYVNNLRELLYDLIELISKKEFQIFLNDEQLKSKKQVKKLIDEKIGCSLDFIIFEEENDSNNSDYYDALSQILDDSTDNENN